jgi:hypothetical protein
LPLGAKALWLQPPATSAAAHALALEFHFALVEDADIADLARSLGGDMRQGASRIPL